MTAADLITRAMQDLRPVSRRVPGDAIAGGDYFQARRLLLLLIVAHVIVMTLFATIARLPETVWDDMLEAWAWGRQFQLGYYKHPPLYAWIAGLWFKVLPRTDASFYLLSAINIGAGLVGVGACPGCFCEGTTACPLYHC